MKSYKRLALSVAMIFTGHWLQGSEIKSPWEKAGLDVGLFLSRIQSHARYGAGLGVDLDPEKLLGLSTQETVFRANGFWRFSDNRRHRLDLMWFSYRRDAERQVAEGFTITGSDGNPIAIAPGTNIQSSFDVDIYETTYAYSFFQDDRFDLSARLGLYMMPIRTEINATGLLETQQSQNFTAPLPVLGYRMDIALTPKWAIRTGTQVFYFEYNSFEGSLLQTQGGVEYKILKNTALGLGFDSFNFNLTSDGSDYPGVDLDGAVGFQYTGLQVYVHWAFN